MLLGREVKPMLLCCSELLPGLPMPGDAVRQPVPSVPAGEGMQTHLRPLAGHGEVQVVHHQ